MMGRKEANHMVATLGKARTQNNASPKGMQRNHGIFEKIGKFISGSCKIHDRRSLLLLLNQRLKAPHLDRAVY